MYKLINIEHILLQHSLSKKELILLYLDLLNIKFDGNNFNFELHFKNTKEELRNMIIEFMIFMFNNNKNKFNDLYDKITDNYIKIAYNYNIISPCWYIGHIFTISK